MPYSIHLLLLLASLPPLKSGKQTPLHPVGEATLQKVLGWKISWEKDLITVTRRPSSSQAKFLLAKARSKKILANTATKEILPASEFTPGLLKSLKALPDSRSQRHV